MAGNLGSSKWVALSRDGVQPGQSALPIDLAYFFSAPYTLGSTEAAGAISVKVLVTREDDGPRTSSISLYRPAILPGTNRCEPRGRRVIDNRHVGINEYRDYHARRGNSSNIEDFHFSYPYAFTECGTTDRPQEVSDTFQFDNVKPTSNDTVVSRLFGSFIGIANASNPNDVSQLRTELHYYSRTDTAPACVGFRVAMSLLDKAASIAIIDISSNWYSSRGAWLIRRR